MGVKWGRSDGGNEFLDGLMGGKAKQTYLFRQSQGEIMKELEEKIRAEGKVYPGRVLKVGSFLNHQIDTVFMSRICKVFYENFKNDGITKILTIEASGIAVACLTAQYFSVPVLFAKKSKSKNIGNDCYICPVTSYTHGIVSDIYLEKELLTSEDKVLIIDDFLANGCAIEGLLTLCGEAGAQVAGAGIVIEKSFQDGGARLRGTGLKIVSLCKIKEMNSEEGIIFEEDDIVLPD